MTGSKRLAILGPAPPDRGGIAHETARLAEELSRLAAVDYLTFSRPYPRWLDPRRFASDPRLPRALAQPLFDYRSASSWRRTAERIADCQADALIVPWWTSFWAIPIRTTFRRLSALYPKTLRLLLCHNVEDHEGGAFRRFLALGAFSTADAFVVHSKQSREELLRRFPCAPVEVLPLPVPECGADRGLARRQLQVVDGPLILFLGLVRRYKGIETLLDAAPRIVHETGARLAIVGEVFPDARGLLRRWEGSPVREGIIWKDEYVSEAEMALWLAASDVVVLPYRRISSSAIAARALGARRPIVASAVGGLSEVVQPGTTGELFAAGDPEGLAEAVSRVLARGIDAYRPGLDRAAREAAWPRYAEGIVSFIERQSRGRVSAL